MSKTAWLVLGMLLAACAGAARGEQAVFEYPSAIVDLHDADDSCWIGMDAAGNYPTLVKPELWLIGMPPSEESAVTLPSDHWVELAFSGRLVDGDGNDITIVESGKAGEQALLFLTDGGDQEYLLSEITVANLMKQETSYVGIDLAGVQVPFVPRSLRLVALDRGGESPGFDLVTIRARVSHGCDTKACCPNPLSGAAGIDPGVRLTWSPGSPADRHVVYLGPVRAQVQSGAAAARYPDQPRDANTFDPPECRLGETYYWRVDEAVGADAGPVQPGDVWSFTVADRLVVDDFESFDLRERFLYETWRIGGRADLSLDQQTFNSCMQSMALQYRYDATSGSEVVREFDPPQDWTRFGAQVLEIMVYGTPGNGTNGQLYCTVSDDRTEQAVPYEGDAEILTTSQWRPWRIPLAALTSVDLANVVRLAIGFHADPANPQGRGSGIIFVDDIVLRPRLCLETGRPAADVTADCTVDYRDMERMAQDWLDHHQGMPAVAAPNEPVLRYEFEGDAADQAGHADGQVEGRCNFDTGVHGQAIHFAHEGDAVTVPEAASVFARTRDAITIAFWQYGDDSAHLNDTVCCSDYVYGQSNPAIAVHLGCWKNPGRYRWDCGYPWSFDNRLAGRHQSKWEWSGRWNHWAFTKDTRATAAGRKGRMAIYLNGVLYNSRWGTDTPITNIASFQIGSGWYGRYDGLIDDFRIYDYALSPAEAAYLAADGTGVLPSRPAPIADLNRDDEVDFHDFAVLASEWLNHALWP